MTMHKALHPRYDVDKQRERGRGLARFEDSAGTSIQRFEHYIEKGGEAIGNDTYNMRINNKCYKKTKMGRKTAV